MLLSKNSLYIKIWGFKLLMIGDGVVLFVKEFFFFLVIYLIKLL